MSKDYALDRKNRGFDASRKQRMAADPSKSVWVEASAGTGKTKVLTDRVLRLLLVDARPEKILCLTYTKAAAVEMNSRIAGKLSRWSILEDKKLEKELTDLFGNLPSGSELSSLKAKARKLFAILLDTPGGMKIQTIHAFCQEVLKRFPLEAKISPYFEVMDDRSSNDALLEIRNDLIFMIEEQPDSLEAKSISYLTRNVSEYSFPNIMTNITQNRSKISDLFEKYSFDEISQILENNLKVDKKKSIEDLIIEYFEKFDLYAHEKIADAWKHGSATEITKGIELENFIKNMNFAENFAVYKLFFLTGDDAPRKSAGNNAAKKYYEDLESEFFGIQGEVLGLMNKIANLRLYNSTMAVLSLAQAMILRYQGYKKQNSKMDYEDLIVLTKNLLSDSAVADWVLFKLDGGIDHVLIDEAQDTSPLQWDIIKNITTEFFAGDGARDVERTVFAVGDRKQSIYSFQGADPKEFEASRKYYQAIAPDFEKIMLDVSFRSVDAVLDLVNEVLKDEKSNKGVVLEGEDVTHLPFKVGDAGRIEVWPLQKVEQEENSAWTLPNKRVVKESASSNLAKQIATYIKKAVDSGVILKSANRPVQYKDFLVLIRRRNQFALELIRECKNLDVSIAGADRIVLLDQIAIKDLLSMAKFLLFPKDDLTLAEVLKSPIFGLDDDDLLNLCYKRGGKSLYQRICEEKTYEKIAIELKTMLNMVDYSRPYELYAHVLNKLGARKKFAERMGVEVLDGIDEFINLTVSFEREHIPSMQKFVAWIEQDDAEIKREQEQSELDAVRIMTVHGAKGLQSPIVILPDTVSVVNNKKGSKLLWDDVFYYPLSSSDYEEICENISDKESELSLEEYYRLLYVAMTRAEDMLCICGYDNKGEAKEESWYDILERNLSKFGSKDEDGILFYETEQRFITDEKKDSKKEDQKDVMPNFSWLREKVLPEDPLAKPYRPSVDENIDEVFASPISDRGENFYRRGTILHKLLQFIPNVSKERREAMIEKFLEKNATDFSAYERKRIIDEILRLFENEEFSLLFGDKSREEVSIMGEVDGKIISAQLDRIVDLGDRIMIVDFKTNRPAAKSLEDVPKIYLKQLSAYRSLLMKIYPNKEVETYILWTDIANLMKIE